MSKPAVICDLDGTLCLHVDRSPYDEAKCDTDVPNIPVLELVLVLRDLNYPIIFVSGRSDKVRDKTVAWLEYHTGLTGPLFMRSAGDYRRDDIVKEELYNANIKDQYEILFCLDDRDRVVSKWRELGLTCLQVAEGAF